MLKLFYQSHFAAAHCIAIANQMHHCMTSSFNEPITVDLHMNNSNTISNVGVQRNKAKIVYIFSSQHSIGKWLEQHEQVICDDTNFFLN